MICVHFGNNIHYKICNFYVFGEWLWCKKDGCCHVTTAELPLISRCIRSPFSIGSGIKLKEKSKYYAAMYSLICTVFNHLL